MIPKTGLSCNKIVQGLNPPPRYKTVTHRFEMKNDESILFLTLVLTKIEAVTTLGLILMKIKRILAFNFWTSV